LHEKTLEQTIAQMQQVEQQIYSIEAANINQETLNAMKNAGQAMKQIHGNLTIDKVDATMDELREQHALGEEIATAIAGAPIGEPIDEQDLEDELEGLEQEALDEKMLKTGPMPVGGEPAKLPSVGNQPRKCCNTQIETHKLTTLQSEEEPRKRTKRKNCGNCRLRWPCDVPSNRDTFQLDFYACHLCPTQGVHAIEAFFKSRDLIHPRLRPSRASQPTHTSLYCFKR
jgi:hypothetical protein